MKNKAAEDAASAAEKVSYPDLGPMAVMAKEGAEAEWSGPLVHISDFDASTGKADLGDIGASESEATEGEMGRALIFGEACRGFGFILNPYTAKINIEKFDDRPADGVYPVAARGVRVQGGVPNTTLVTPRLYVNFSKPRTGKCQRAFPHLWEEGSCGDSAGMGSFNCQGD
jgi:hypothetical protein